MVACNFAFVIQIISIIASILGIVCGIYNIFDHFTVGGLILSIFTIIFCLMLILVEVHIFKFFMYFAFIITFWGKGIMYLFMGFFIFSKSSTFAIVVAVIFWCLFVLCVISFFFAKGSSAPLLQKGEPPSFDLSSADFYGGESGGKKESKKSKSGVEDNKDSDYYKEDPEN